jgi:hypothetical protein
LAPKRTTQTGTGRRVATPAASTSAATTAASTTSATSSSGTAASATRRKSVSAAAGSGSSNVKPAVERSRAESAKSERVIGHIRHAGRQSQRIGAGTVERG